MRLRTLLVCLTALSLGCASIDEGHGRIPPGKLLAGAPLIGTHTLPALVDDSAVLALNAEMRRFVDANVHHRASRPTRVQQLIDAIISKDTFGLEFEEVTRTASEIFRVKRGNCLSFSNMYVAMARYAGLDASFQEVDIPPDWTIDEDAFVLNRHVNVHVSLGNLGEHMVDFNIDYYRSSYDTRQITDTRARAHYYNNMGVERMQAGDAVAAVAYFRKAIAENDTHFSPAWTNLGTLYRRHDLPDYAESAYLQALKADSHDFVAMSNMAGFYEQQGDVERAAAYRKKVSQHRKRNPYYRFHRALDAYTSGDYDEAIKNLKHAIGKKRNEDQFYYLLGMCHLRKGNERAARRCLAKAEEVAATEALKRKYSSKLDTILAESGHHVP